MNKDSDLVRGVSVSHLYTALCAELKPGFVLRTALRAVLNTKLVPDALAKCRSAERGAYSLLRRQTRLSFLGFGFFHAHLLTLRILRDLLFIKIPVSAWRSETAPR
jgi:hypothetical protein